jgi:hypothetical protein
MQRGSDMDDIGSDFFTNGNKPSGSCKWVIESSSPDDLYHKIGITKFDNVFVAYKPENNRNMAQFYERLLGIWENKNIFYMLIYRNLEKIRYVLGLIDGGHTNNPIEEVPDELLSLYDNWGWIETGFGVNEGGLISRYYGITTDGIGVQILEKPIYKNMAKVFYMILSPYNNESNAGNFLNAIFSADSALDFFCDQEGKTGKATIT